MNHKIQLTLSYTKSGPTFVAPQAAESRCFAKPAELDRTALKHVANFWLNLVHIAQIHWKTFDFQYPHYWDARPYSTFKLKGSACVG